MSLLFMLAANVLMYFVARANYLLFHALAEGFAILVAALIYVLSVRTYKYSQNHTFLFLGKAYFFVAILDFFHMLTYKGMGVFPKFGTDVPTQLWVAGRFMEALAFVVLPHLFGREIHPRIPTLVLGFITSGFLLSIMVFEVFPECFIEGVGLTTFKIASEYVIVLALLISSYRLYRKKVLLDDESYKPIVIAMLITAASELTFTLYTDVYGVFNMLGHMLKIASYYVIYTEILLHGIDEPYSLVSGELKQRALRDPLTNLCNRKGMAELMEKELASVMGQKGSLGVLMIDLDNFKHINDNYGHIYGDEVLMSFADLLKRSIRGGDTACRFGGDEFVVLAGDVDSEELIEIKRRIENAASRWFACDERLRKLGISIGDVVLRSGQVSDIETLIKKADESMYEVKQRKKKALYDLENHLQL